VDVELQVIPDCPYAGSAQELLRGALDDIGLGHIVVRTTIVATDEDAHKIGFVGSPTFVVDGHDLFAEAGATPAVTCRLYRANGGVAPLPEPSRLRQELRRATAGPPLI